MSTVNDFLKNCSKVWFGYAYNPWLTRTWQTSFQQTWKAALPPSFPFQDPFSFLLFALPPPAFPPPSFPPPLNARALSVLLWKLPVEKLGSLGKLRFLSWKEQLCATGTVGLDPRGGSRRRPGGRPNIFSNVMWLFLTLFTFIHLDCWVSFFKRCDVWERDEEKNLCSFISACEMTTYTSTQASHMFSALYLTVYKGFCTQLLYAATLHMVKLGLRELEYLSCWKQD